MVGERSVHILIGNAILTVNVLLYSNSSERRRHVVVLGEKQLREFSSWVCVITAYFVATSIPS